MFWAWRVLRWWHSRRVCQQPTMDWVQSRLASCACCEQMETSRVVRALPRAESSTSAGRSSVPGLSQRTSVQRRTHRSELPLARLAPRVPFLNAQQEHRCPASRCCRPHTFKSHVSTTSALLSSRIPGALLLKVEQECGAQVVVDVPRDHALQVHSLLGVRKTLGHRSRPQV